MVKKLFLTPPDTPSETQCRSLEIPSSQQWLGIFNAALLTMANQYNYEQVNDTDITPEEAAAVGYAVYEAYLTSVCGAPDEVQAPFWDETSGDDADDTAPAGSQDWYGTWDGETFLETTAYVFLTNFLSTLIAPTAAIKFLTLPRVFRMAIRQNPHGANLLLFLDGGLFKVINGYSPFDRVAEFLIASPGTEMLLVHAGTHDEDATPDADGNYTIDVIRGRLAESDVAPTNIRFSGDPPVYQYSPDGGTTWVDQPASNPLHSRTALFPPLTPYEGIECDAAARMSAQLKDCITAMCTFADTAQAVTAILELILLPTGLVGMIWSLLFWICDQIIDQGQEVVLAAFTDAVYDDITCTLRCFIAPDGSISQSNLDAAWEKVKTDHAGTVATVIDEVRFLFTDVVFSNAGVGRTETGDCDACDSCGWIVEYDFTSGNTQGWQSYVDSAYAYGAFVGNAFKGSHTGTPVELFFYLLEPGLVITGLSLYGDVAHGTGIGNTFNIMQMTSTGDPPTWSIQSSGGIADWSGHFQSYSPSFTTNQGIGFYMVCDNGRACCR